MTKLLIRSSGERSTPVYDRPEVATLPPTPAKPELRPRLTGLRGIHPIPPQPPTPREIRDHAYYLYLERAGCGGDSCEDWLRAEREMWTAYHRNLQAYMRLIDIPSA